MVTLLGQIAEVPAEHGADLEVAEEDRRAQADRAQPLALQLEGRALARRPAGSADPACRRNAALRLALLGRRPHADVGARQQRIEAGDVAGEELRLDHPEDRLVGQQRLGLAHRLHRHQHVGRGRARWRCSSPCPSTTFLYLSWDWPAVRPAAVSKEMVMVGPRLEKVSQASHAAISAVSSGTIQTSGMRRRRWAPAVGNAVGPVRCHSLPSIPPLSVARRVTQIDWLCNHRQGLRNCRNPDMVKDSDQAR